MAKKATPKSSSPDGMEEAKKALNELAKADGL